MFYSTLNDPVDVARACAALEQAWAEIRQTAPADLECARDTLDRERLAMIVAGLVMTANDETDLARIAIRKFRRERSASDTGPSGTHHQPGE